jgi:uncharacterized C2H2 Zn-finger protein
MPKGVRKTKNAPPPPLPSPPPAALPDAISPPSPSSSDSSGDNTGSNASDIHAEGSFDVSALRPGSPIHGAEGIETNNVVTCQWKDCGIVFDHLPTLINHIHNEHIGVHKSNYTCEWTSCLWRGLPQTSQFALISHIRSHTGEKPFICPLPECDKSFTRSDALAKHMRLQHNISPPAPGRGGNRKRKRDDQTTRLRVLLRQLRRPSCLLLLLGQCLILLVSSHSRSSRKRRRSLSTTPTRTITSQGRRSRQIAVAGSRTDSLISTHNIPQDLKIIWTLVPRTGLNP